MSTDQSHNALPFRSTLLPLRALVPSWFQFLLQPVCFSTLRFTVLLFVVVVGLSSSANAQTNVFPSTGNVGIGTTTPSALLHLTTGGNNGEIIETTSTNGYSFFALKADNSGWLQFGKFSSNKTGTTFGVNNADAAFLYTTTTASAFPSSLLIGTFSSAPIILGTNGVERLRVDSLGNVGIGTTSPTALFNVHGATGIKVSSSSNYGFLNLVPGGDTTNSGSLTFGDGTGWKFNIGKASDSGATKFLTIQDTGNVGIGTTSPLQRLSVIGAGNATALFNVGKEGDYYGSWMGGSQGNNPHVWVGDWYSAGGGLTWSSTTGDLLLDTYSISQDILVATNGGNVGIGTTSPSHKLAVNGTIRAKEVIVDTGWADHVFSDDYRLAPLSEVEGAIKRDGHLPGIPSAAEVAEHGVSMGEMQAKLLAKVEELTLHVIAQEKRMGQLGSENASLRHEVEALKQTSNH